MGPRFPSLDAAVARRRVTVAVPAIRRGPVCARRGCRWTAWFAIHHVPVCSSACAEAIAREKPTAAVVRAVQWVAPTGVAWTLVVASTGRRHDRLAAWWWSGHGTIRDRSGRFETSRGLDVTTDDGLFQFLRYLVRKGATDLRPWRIAATWTDIALPQDPVVLARGIVRKARALARARERVRALRARYRQRGTSQDGTTAHASRVA